MKLQELTKVTTDFESNVTLFSGIRYAIPPLNELRFRQAQLYNKSYDGTYNATQFGVMYSTSKYSDANHISEDCLFLNIWTMNAEPKAAAFSISIWINYKQLFFNSFQA